MNDLIIIAFTAFLTENVVLAKFMGICPFLGVSKKRSSAIGMGLAVVFVITVSSIVTWLLYYQVLVPAKIEFLQTLVFILVIASLVQIVEVIVKRISPVLYRSLGIYLPLISTNCAVLGVASLIISENYVNFFDMLVYSLASSLGFFFVLFIFSGLRSRVDHAPVKKAIKGIPLALLVAAGMAIIFSRLGILF